MNLCTAQVYLQHSSLFTNKHDRFYFTKHQLKGGCCPFHPPGVEKKATCTLYITIGANRPETPRTVPDLERLSCVPPGNEHLPQFSQNSTDP